MTVYFNAYDLSPSDLITNSAGQGVATSYAEYKTNQLSIKVKSMNSIDGQGLYGCFFALPDAPIPKDFSSFQALSASQSATFQKTTGDCVIKLPDSYLKRLEKFVTDSADPSLSSLGTMYLFVLSNSGSSVSLAPIWVGMLSFVWNNRYDILQGAGRLLQSLLPDSSGTVVATGKALMN